MENVDFEMRGARTPSKLPRIMSNSLDSSLQQSNSSPQIVGSSLSVTYGSEKLRRGSGGLSPSPTRKTVSPPLVPPTEPLASNANLSPTSEGVAYSLYERYIKDKEKCTADLESLKEKLQTTVANLEVARDLTEKLNTNIVDHQQNIAKLSIQLEQDKGNIVYQEEKLRVQLQSDKEENYVLLRDKMEAEHLLTSAKNELSAIENRNRAFESKLATANKELLNVLDNTQRLANETKMKKEIYETELKKLTSESSELTRSINATNTEIEHLVEVQTALETQLSTVKKEMMSLATQLEKKFEQEEHKRNEKITDSEEVPAPTGEVTIVFSDIPDAVYLWEHIPEDVMIITVEIYNRILRDKLKELGGYEVKSEGEVFMASFSSPVNAVKWCHTVQEALLVADWPERLLSEDKCSQKTSSDGRLLFRGASVRMGMNNGSPELKPSPITGRADYFGPCVNKSARVSGLSQGGQVLISESVYQQIVKDPDLIKHSSAVSIGKFMLRGFQEEEQIYQILPRTLADRSFGSSNEPPANIQEIASTRKRPLKNRTETPPPKAGIVQEVSQLVKEIEDTLVAHGLAKEVIEENPLTKKKHQLTERLNRMGDELNQAKDVVAELKKEKQSLLKQERSLKEELASEVDHKDSLDEKVTEYVKEKIEKDTTLEKTFKNMESIAIKQRELDKQLRDAKVLRNALQKKLSEMEIAQNEAKLNMLREKAKEVDGHLRKAEMHKELRGKYLKNLETNVEKFISDIFNHSDKTAFHIANIQKAAHTAVVNQDRTSQTPSPMLSPSPVTVVDDPSSTVTSPTHTPEISESILQSQQTPPSAPDYSGFPSYATRHVEFFSYFTHMPKGEFEKIQQETDYVESLRRISELEMEIEQVKMEKELYFNQAETLETYFKQIDETEVEEENSKRVRFEDSEPEEIPDAAQEQELLELKEKQKALLHQLTIALTEKDVIRKQLNDLRINGSHEITRKEKALEKAKSEAAYLMQAQYFLRQVLLNQYKHLKNKKTARTFVREKEKDTDKNVDYLNILKLHSILEENLRTTRLQAANAATTPKEEPRVKLQQDKNQIQQTVQIEVLGKLLRGEVVLNEELRKAGVGGLNNPTKSSGLVIEIGERPRAGKPEEMKIMGRRIDVNTKT